MLGMFSLYSTWDKYNADVPLDENNKVSLSSFRSLPNVASPNTLSHSPRPLSASSFGPTNLQEVSRSPSFAQNENIAVEIRNAKLSYGKGKKVVNALRGINLTVPAGGIYGLLGPSGCGKTSLLRCLVGRLSPTEGSIKVLGKRPGASDSRIPGPDIGYMPQEIALFPDFSIEETLNYFGNLFRMKKSVIKSRTEFILKFLDLVDKTRLVGNLSGGQKRRVSLAAALVHNPPLLILDEPTVGVDPLLRQSIWDYLVELSKNENLTVIITTHYIEEARCANMVGMMRFGRILLEAEPNYLMKRFNFPTLEEVFLKVCEMDSAGISVEEIKDPYCIAESDLCIKPYEYDCNSNTSSGIGVGDGDFPSQTLSSASSLGLKFTDVAINAPIKKHSIDRGINKSGFDSVARTSALFWKNITRLRRNMAVLLFQFLLPSIEVILFCACIGRDPFDITVAVYNQEKPMVFSEWFLQTIDNYTIIQVEYDTLEGALHAVRHGDAWGAIAIGKNFSNALQTRVMLAGSVDNDTLEQSKVHLYTDMTNEMISLKLYQTVVDGFIKFGKEVLIMMDQSTSFVELPVVLENPVYGNKAPSFTEFMAPGVILSIAYLAAVALTALAFVMERKEGLLERSLVAGVTPSEFMLSHVLTQLLVLAVQVALLLIFTFLVFEIPSRGPFIWVILLTFLQGATGMAMGLMISSLCEDENSATMLALGSFYPNLLLSGTVWPTQAMPAAIRYFSYILPQTIPIEALRYILSRGWDPSYHEVGMGFLVTIIWITIFLTSGIIIFKYKK